MKRAAHVAAVILAVAGAVAMALEKVSPKWAAPLAVAVALIANLQTALKGAIDKGIVGLFLTIMLGHALYGCATAKAIATSCVPTVSDVSAVWSDAQTEGYIGALESFVAQKGLCLVQAAVDQAIQQHTVAAEVILAAAPDGGTVPFLKDGDFAAIARLQLWRAQHP